MPECIRKAPARRETDGPKIYTLDIETSPIVSFHWGLFDQNISPEHIVEEWSILSFSAKKLGDREIVYHDTGGRGAKRVRDDKALLAKIWKVLDDADIIVVQNGKKFDFKKINARLVEHGFAPPSPYKVVDTYLVAKKHFAFTSGRLVWLSKHLAPETQKSSHKRFPGFELWQECLKDNPAAWAEMRRYNCRDTVATERVYLKLRPWIEGHPNVAAYMSVEQIACPKCGGVDVQMRGHSLTQTGEYHRYQCKTCGGWARSRYTLNTMSKRRRLLSN